MISPSWFASPPELHSTLLSTGAGAGPLLAAADAWRSLSNEYASAAKDLTAVLTAVHTTDWQGPSAERFVAAHQPFLGWLDEASTMASIAATGHETAACGYLAALAAMPTLAELAANHAVHGVLVATNFFGVNTIPIAVNEADYLRMWNQAASVMSTYQLTAETALTLVPPSSTAPQIVRSEASASATTSSFPDPAKLIIQALQSLLEQLSDLAVRYLPGPLGRFVSQALDSLVSFMSSQWFLIPAYSTLDPLIYFGPFIPALLPFIAPIGTVGLVGIAGIPQDQTATPAPETTSGTPLATRPVSPVAHAAGLNSTTSSAGSAGSGNPAPATTASALPAGNGVIPADIFYVIGSGPDGEGFTPTSRTGVEANLTAASTIPETMPAQREPTRATKHARRHQRGYKHQFEYLDADTTMTPPAHTVTASQSGFSAREIGPIANNPMPAKGLTRIHGHTVSESPREPMLPQICLEQTNYGGH